MRLYYSWVPSWKNWDKERGFVEAEIVPPRVIVDPESGATIFAAIFQGRWTTQALALARGSSDALLPKRHIWKLFGQGAATLVVYVDSDTEPQDERYCRSAIARGVSIGYRALSAQWGAVEPRPSVPTLPRRESLPNILIRLKAVRWRNYNWPDLGTSGASWPRHEAWHDFSLACQVRELPEDKIQRCRILLERARSLETTI